MSELNVYPNPTRGKTKITFSSDRETKMHLKVVDIIGKTIHSEDIDVITGYNEKEIDLENLSQGVYLIQLNSSGVETKSLRIVVEK